MSVTISEKPTPIAASAANGNGLTVRQPRPQYQRFDPERVVGTMTLDEWDTFLEKAKHKYHYVYGKVVQMAGASFEHNQLQMNMAFEVRLAFRDASVPCQILGSDQRVFVRRKLYYFPDLIVVCGEVQVDEREALRNPAAIVEVLSPTTETDDRTDKFREYQQIESLRHYVLVDQNRVAVTHYEKQPGGLWAIRGDYREPSDALKLTFGDSEVSLTLSQIYRDVALPEPLPESVF